MEENRKKLRVHNGWLTIATYYRLFIPQIFFHYRRILYLDCDMILNADVAELYSTDFDGKSLVVVKDFGFSGSEHAARVIGKGREEWYFNAGVLLFDIEKNLKKHLTTRCLEYVLSKKDDREQFFEDQDTLNAVCCGDVEFINDEWNVPSRIGDSMLVERAKIMHFMGPRKPWKEFSNLSSYWWHYAEKTPFYKDIIVRNKIRLYKVNLTVACYFTKSFCWFYKIIPFKRFTRRLVRRIIKLSPLTMLRNLPILEKLMNSKNYPSEYVYLLQAQMTPNVFTEH